MSGGKKGKRKDPPSHQSTLTSKSTRQKITVTSVSEKYMRTEILLTDQIYDGRVPDEAMGKLFLYTVHSYDEKSQKFTVKYGKQSVEPAVRFV